MAGEAAAKTELLKREVQIDELVAEIRHGRDRLLGERAAHERAHGEVIAQLQEGVAREDRLAREISTKDQHLATVQQTLSSERGQFQHKMGELKAKVESLSEMMQQTLARNKSLEIELARLQQIAEIKIALEHTLSERSAALLEARSRETVATEQREKAVAEMEGMVGAFRKDLADARAREAELQDHISRFSGSNQELVTKVSEAQHRSHRLEGDLDYVKSHSMLQWVDRTVDHQVSSSIDRMGREAARQSHFVHALQPPLLPHPPSAYLTSGDYSAAFNAMDKNNDGVISRNEWQQAEFSARYPHLAKNVL